MRLAYQSDDGFREIQLNGKQLVFLFMAATVVSVVIFLCGVLVGRGARRVSADPATVASAESVVTEIPVETAATPPATTQPEAAEPPPTPADELTYYERLEKTNPRQKRSNLQKPSGRNPRHHRGARRHARYSPRRPPRQPPPTPLPRHPEHSVPRLANKHVCEPVDLGMWSGGSTPVRVEAERARTSFGEGVSCVLTAPASGASGPFIACVAKVQSRRSRTSGRTLEKEEQFKPLD